ncbi:hypothetical protein P43SY_002314 [Pythium insidiosum]|uniref:EGF-like domain-containing protein n=1 Tax=Pythium insidiosum TaxID=114742 RepID=A0AAD5MBA8_PYTIN|nr:hypothetical protein P43SY_002314 [Pythium insidiosum]
MGALGANRAEVFRERFGAMSQDMGHGPMDTPAFHYGTHYSCSAYVINYLIRLEPFSKHARDLQGGNFDHADRLFRSIPASWSSASAENLQDVRELIPEFYFLPEFLYNANNYDLGTTQSGEVVSHVKLPPWAHNDPREFIRLHRRALESRFVSENLHQWIDLVFGYKQTGEAAFEAQNVFMHFTYEADCYVIVWDLRTKSFLRELVGHSAPVGHVGINASNGNIVTASTGELRVWSINGDLLAATTMSSVGLAAVTSAISTRCESWQRGVVAVTGHSNGTIALWGLNYPSDIALARGSSPEAKTTDRSSDLTSSGSLKTAVRIGATLKAIPTCQLFILKLLLDHRVAVTSLTLGPEQRQLLSGDSEGNCIRWIDDSITTNIILQVVGLLLLLLLLLSSPLSAHSHANGTNKAHHHHCIHDAKIDALERSVDPASLVVPQLVMPFESPSDIARDSFLRLVGATPRLRGSDRSLAATASTSPFQPLRIVFDLSKLSSDPGYMCTREGEKVTVDGQVFTCGPSDVLTATKREFLTSVLLPAVHDYFGGTLSVQRVVGNLVVAGLSCSSTDEWACCARSMPSEYRTSGVADADFLLHVTARPTTGATIAWALPCNVDQFGRPISGQANFGPGRIDTAAAARTEQVGTAIHEVTHALVFSRGRFGDFRQPLNGPRWGYSNVVFQSQGAGGVTVSKIVTPSVAQRAKQHFNCPDWVNAGLELENGASGSADFSSHWEKRLLMNEYMTATSSYDPVYSALTLALFEDSGWYQVNYKNAQVLPWGYLEGCGVATGRCSEWSSRYTCTAATQTQCTPDFNSKGYCNVARYTSSIPAGFQYFSDPMFGGRDSFADYCPFYRAYSNGDCRGIGRSATMADTGDWMEEVGPSSKCFESSLSRRSSDSDPLRSSCYRVLGCSPQGLRLSIGGKDVLCPLQGGEITVPGYRGRLQCPVANRLCQMIQQQCSGNGVLLATGACQCNPGFVGDDCSGVACPSGQNGQECSGSSRGSCDYTTGTCRCATAYTGLSCSELLCPAFPGGKSDAECSGHGTCNRAYGQCQCANGYSGKACECVPGCTAATCLHGGKCDCTTGACVCATGYSGPTCATPAQPVVREIYESGAPVQGTVAAKAYDFYKIYLSSSSYDITFVLQYDNASGTDADLYGSFVDPFPTSLTAATSLFSSDYGIGGRDEVNLCGSLGVFPRGLNDTFRYCPRPTAPYLLETPGYFYLSVLGYAGGPYTLRIETDKCRNVTCSGHGACGVHYAGVCSCNRYWTGDDCSVPRCGPDCIDLGTCFSKRRLEDAATTIERGVEGTLGLSVPSSGTVENAAAGPSLSLASLGSNQLRNTSECYGNGVCVVPSGDQQPRCECDEPFRFANPTAAQALCKELVPDVASIRYFTEPFQVRAEQKDDLLGAGAWALFTLSVVDAWEIAVVTLEVLNGEADAMLFVRKDKLPSVAAGTQSQSFLQFTDTERWSSGAATRKIALNRAGSTLSSGLYYVGVYNSPYARGSLSYRLTVNATASCSSDPQSFGVCENGAACSATSSPICACPTGYTGRFCDVKAQRTVLGPSVAAPASQSYLAFRSEATQVLAVGDWAYFSFDISDESARLVQIRLTIENDQTVATPVLPLLLVRGPSEDGFPSLATESHQDFAGVSRRAATQVVTLAVDTVCSFAASSRDCYKVAVHNRDLSGSALRYRLEVEIFSTRSAVFASPSTCGATGDQLNCHGNGRCLMVADAAGGASYPTCRCTNGWTGLQCNSPRAFSLPQLWSAMKDVGQLCTVCSTDFSLPRGELRLFRVPESLRDGVGLRLRVRPADGGQSVGGLVPNVYVSETVPRSMYDFTHISTTNTTDSTVKEQTVELANGSFSGHFWVVVYSDSPSTAAVNVSASSLQSSRRRLAASASSSSSASSPPVAFRLVVELYELPRDAETAKLLTQQSFAREVFNWLFHTPTGIVVFVFSLLFLVLMVCFCLWRLCHAPENQDKVTRRFFSANAANREYTPSGPTLGRLGQRSAVSDVELSAPHTRL